MREARNSSQLLVNECRISKENRSSMLVKLRKKFALGRLQGVRDSLRDSGLPRWKGPAILAPLKFSLKVVRGK